MSENPCLWYDNAAANSYEFSISSMKGGLKLIVHRGVGKFTGAATRQFHRQCILATEVMQHWLSSLFISGCGIQQYVVNWLHWVN